MELDTLAPQKTNFLPQDEQSRKGRQLIVEQMLLDGKTYSQIQEKTGCSSSTVARISKSLVRRNNEDNESVREILKTRMLAIASKSLTKLNEGIETEDDLKTIEKIFSSTYDRATDSKNNRDSTTVNIQLANMFSTDTEVKAKVTVDHNNDKP